MASVASRPDSLIEQRVRVGGVRTRALRLEGDGPPLLLLHGFADSADTWRGVLGEIAQAGRAAVALDLPGFATADPLPAGEGVIERMGDFAAAAAEHFGESGNAVVAGNSLGGAAALLAATRTDVGGVVAIAPAGFDLGQWIYRLENFWLLQTLLRMPPLVPGTLLRSIVGQVYRQLAICDQRAVSAEVVSRFASHHRDRSTVMRYLQTARLLLPELMQPLALEGITAPVLIVWGSRDRMLPSRNAELVLEQIPHARVELIDRCGHCPQVERPQLTAKLLLRGP